MNADLDELARAHAAYERAQTFYRPYDVRGVRAFHAESLEDGPMDLCPVALEPPPAPATTAHSP